MATKNPVRSLKPWMSAGIVATMMSLAGCGGVENSGTEPAAPVDSGPVVDNMALSGNPQIPPSNDPDALLKVAIIGNHLYVALSRDGRSIYKSTDGARWEVAFTHDRRKFRELSFEDGSFVARTRRVRFVSSDPLAAIWTRDKAVHGRKHKDAIAKSYMVMFDEDAAIDDIERFTRDLESQVNSSGGNMHVKSVYKLAGPGFSATMSEASLEILRNNPAVAYVQQEFKMQFIEPVSSKPANPVAEAMAEILAAGSQTTPSSMWNLDRIDQVNMPLSGQYKYPASGKGVHAYIWDTGIRQSHSEFSGKAFGAGKSASPCDYGMDHGTHVAGTVGGRTYGVAKDVTLHNIHMSGCDTGGGIYAGIDVIEFVMADVMRHGGRGVVNMSFGSTSNGFGPSAWNDALTNATNAGVVFVAAAGNSGEDPVLKNRDACNMWPAHHPSVIAVGSYGRNNQARSYFSNMGSCITLFAPGEEILSAGTANDTAIVGKQGTSMAAPHVVGAVTIYLEMYPKATVKQVKDALIAASSKGVIRASDIGAGSPNRLLNINFPAPGNPPDGGDNNVPSGFVKCADENGTCFVNGTGDVIYGAKGKFAQKFGVSGNISCNNNTFGDPIAGTYKACYYKQTSNGDGGPAGFTKCANEGGTCTLSGTRNVAYGANGKFTHKSGLSGNIACNNSTFGDPNAGIYKACYYQ